MSAVARRIALGLSAAALFAAPGAQALTFELDYGDGIQGTLNSFITFGAGIRVEDRSTDLLGKGNIDPQVCGAQYQSCQGTFRDQIHPAARNASAPGQATYNADDGNWNYGQGDLTQVVFKVTQDLSLTYGDYGFFAKWLYFYDFVNNDFTEFHPNRITCDDPANIATCQNRASVGTTGDPQGANAIFDRVYGPGAPVEFDRTDGEVLRQIGTSLQPLDYYVYGTLPLLGDKELTVKLGNQTLNWGESTALVINSLNQVNPVNANSLLRVGFDLSELFIPTGMLFLSAEPFEAATVEFFYGYDWEPVEIFTPGSFFSYLDIGTNNAVDFVGFNFGTPAEDPQQAGFPAENPLSGLTNTSTAIQRLPDNEASDSGQFGLGFKYFAEWLNNGTELGFYFMNYHSKLPYVSFYASDMSCAREGGVHGENPITGQPGEDINATDIATFGAACPDLPVFHGNAGPYGTNDPENATSDAVPFDTVQFLLEYPEDIQLFGFSFNTTVGNISLQGEVAYRPDMPLQVDAEDLAFHAVGPTLAACHDESVGCAGSNGGEGFDEDGNTVAYGSSDFVPYPGTGITAYPDTFDLAAGAGVGSARSFPSFIGAYRGVAPGSTPPNSYIQGWEYFDVWQFNVGATYIEGATDGFADLINADQSIWLFEVGAQWVPDLPDTDVLQIEAPGTFYHASAGADGSMTGNYRQDCAHTVDCHFGADGLRFNPHQQDHDAYADDISAGYVVINLTRFESVFPGISFAPITIFQHDVIGTSTDAAAQFTEGRIDLAFIFETRYKESLSFYVGYLAFLGGGRYNLQADRDQALAYVKYLF